MLACDSCGATFADTGRKRCECGEPLWYVLDLDGSSIRTEERGLARYLDFLPVDELQGLGTGVGETPLFEADRLTVDADYDLFLKDETVAPTGSFKDRGSAVGVAAALERGHDAVGTVSHGNMAMSMAATAASVGMECHVFVPEDIPEERLAYIGQYGPTVVTVEGDYGQLYDESVALETGRSIDFVNSDVPLRVAGQKTTGMEIVEAFDLDGPDALVLPTSSGGHASAVWKGLRDLQAASLLEAFPRLYFVQAAACDPIATAFRDGADDVSPISKSETIAYSIANADPPSGNRALAAARATDGGVLSVSDEEILDAMDRLAKEAGICAEPAGATTLAGIDALSDRGEIGSGETVVGIITGTGFTEEIRTEVAPPEHVALGDLGDYLDRVGS